MSTRPEGIYQAFTAYYNAETGELYEILKTKRFTSENSLMRSDVLSDAVGELEASEESDQGEFCQGITRENQIAKLPN